ncbi:hypothetical protein IJMDGFEA_00059 [Klebsiella phage KP5]|nr:hypothetical protein OOGAAMIP_00063 [Klebsiella phage Kp11_Ajakkala-2023]
MKKPLTLVGAFCYIGSIENNEEYIMKYLLLALSLLATPALAFEEPPPMDKATYDAMSDDEKCEHLPTYQMMSDWLKDSKVDEKFKTKVITQYLYSQNQVCLMTLRIKIRELEYELNTGKKLK